MKKLLSIFLAVALVFSTVIVTTEPAKAATSDWLFYGSTCTSNSSAASTINYVLAKYDQYSTYTGSGECFGWTERVCNLLAAERSTKYYDDLKFTVKNFRAKCLGLKAGAHLRLSNEKEYNPWSGHSVCLLKVTEDDVCWTDNNAVGYETIAYYRGTLEQFVARYGSFEYMNMVIKNTKYKTQVEPKLAVEKTGSGKPKLYWTKTSNTSKYKIYRSTSKNGTYKLIKTTTSKNYLDSSAKYGKKYYYKVKSVKKYTTDKTSNIFSCTPRLATPVITDYTTNLKSGGIKITWKKVTNADKYYIYRSVNHGDYKYYAATTKTSWTNSKNVNPKNSYSYKVRAIYKADTDGNSYRSEPTYYIYPRIAAPKVSKSYNASTNELTLSWPKVSYATSYRVGFYENGNYDWYSYYNSTTELKQVIDMDRFYPGNYYEFFVLAYPDSGSTSVPSSLVKVTINEDGTVKI